MSNFDEFFFFLNLIFIIFKECYFIKLIHKNYYIENSNKKNLFLKFII